VGRACQREACSMTCLLHRQSVHLLKSRTWKDCDEKIHFESGVHMGIGTFNLVRSRAFLAYMFFVVC